MQTYTYRLLIANKKHVTGELRGPDGAPQGSPMGPLGLGSAQLKKIQAAASRIRQGAATPQDPKMVGDALFEALLPEGELRGRFFDYYEKARGEDALLRLELEVDERALPEVAALPWEFLHIRAELGHGQFWAATNPVLAFSRQRSRLNLPAPLTLAPGEKLRIGVAVAAPKGFENQTPYQEFWSELQALASEAGEKLELLPLVEKATPRALDQLLQARPHVLHCIAHGFTRVEGRDGFGFIQLVRESGLPQLLDGAEFAELFVRWRPGMVLLTTCESAAQDSGAAFAGVASQIVDQNIPVVIAMQYEISNAAARRFGRTVYRRIAGDEPVDKAVQEGRRELANQSGYEKRDFATPVLYMRVLEAQVFRRAGPAVQTAAAFSGRGGFWQALQARLESPGQGALRREIVAALLTLDCMADARRRGDVVKELPARMRNNIERRDDSRGDVNAILNTVLNYEGGWQGLVEAIENHEPGDKTLSEFKARLQGLV